MLISILTVLTYKGVPPKTQNLFIKTCVFILTCLNFSHLQSTLHLMQYTYGDTFFHCSKQFLNSLVLMPFSAYAIFCITSSTSAKCFLLRTFFIQGNTQKSHLGWDQVNRQGRACRVIFTKHWWILSTVWAGVLINHPSCNGQTRWVFKKNSLKLNAASHNTTSWYTATDEFLNTYLAGEAAHPPEDNYIFCGPPS